MKNLSRFICLLIVGMITMTVIPTASAEQPSVYIPKRAEKLVDSFVEDYKFPTLVARGDSLGYGLYSDGVIHFRFSEKPDWFSAVVSSKNGGCMNIDVNSYGYAELPLEDLVMQPGMYAWNNPELTYWDQNCNLRFRKDWVNTHGLARGSYKKDDLVPFRFSGVLYGLYGNTGDYPYSAGKDYGDYSVTVNYHRDGSAYKVAVTLKNVDFFETGMEDAVSTITFELVNVALDSYETLYLWYNREIDGVRRWKRYRTKADNSKITTKRDEDGKIEYLIYDDRLIIELYDFTNTEVWYVSSVSTSYPEGNQVVGVEADYKNDEKHSLYQYKVSYAVNEKDVAQIYYKTDDTPFYGLYSKDGEITAVSGSGNNLNKWYTYNGYSEHATIRKPVMNEKTGEVKGYTLEREGKLNNNGKQVKTIKKGINSYPSPRVITK